MQSAQNTAHPLVNCKILKALEHAFTVFKYSISINSPGIYKKNQSTRLSIGLQHNVIIHLIPNISKTEKFNGSTNALCKLHVS